MDPITNPFSPGAGSPPPELVGRDPLLEQSRILLGRIRQKRPEKSLLLTGLRGVGKTVLLNEIERQARAAGYRTIVIEAHEGKPLGPLLAPYLRGVLYELDRVAGAGDKVKRGLRVLRSFLGALKITYADIELGLDIDPEVGSADSGDMEIDLSNLFEAFVSELSIEALDECIFHRLTWPDELKRHAASMSPEIQSVAGELGPVVTDDALRQTARQSKSVQHLNYSERRKRVSYLDCRTFPCHVIDDVETTELPSVGQRIRHKVHAPPLVRRRWSGQRNSRHRYTLLPSPA